MAEHGAGASARVARTRWLQRVSALAAPAPSGAVPGTPSECWSCEALLGLGRREGPQQPRQPGEEPERSQHCCPGRECPGQPCPPCSQCPALTWPSCPRSWPAGPLDAGQTGSWSVCASWGGRDPAVQGSGSSPLSWGATGGAVRGSPGPRCPSGRNSAAHPQR